MKGQYEFECYEKTKHTIKEEWHGTAVEYTTTYRFRFKAPNGKILFPSHPYDSKAARTRGIAAIRKGVPDAKVTQA